MMLTVRPFNHYYGDTLTDIKSEKQKTYIFVKSIEFLIFNLNIKKNFQLPIQSINMYLL